MSAPLTLAQLSLLINKTPECYMDSFETHLNLFINQSNLYLLDMSALFPETSHTNEQMTNFEILNKDRVRELNGLMTFFTGTAHFYKDCCAKLSNFIEKNYVHDHNVLRLLDSDMRINFCRFFSNLKNRNIYDKVDYYTVLGRHFLACPDKHLRRHIVKTFISSICVANRQHFNGETNKRVCSMLLGELKSASIDSQALNKAVCIYTILINLFHRDRFGKQCWQSADLLNQMVEYVFVDNAKLNYMSLNFVCSATACSKILSKADLQIDSDENDEADVFDAMMMVKASRSHKKPKMSRNKNKKEKKLQRAMDILDKVNKRKEGGKFLTDSSQIDEDSAVQLFKIELLYDGHAFAERLMKKLAASKNTLDLKILMMECLSRVLSVHKVVLSNFYIYINRYLRPHQQQEVRILSLLAQSCHEHTPKNGIRKCLKTIADNFISQHSPSEVSSVALNTIREICWRCSYCLDKSLARDLVSLYRVKNCDKIVTIASKSLLKVLRIVNPKILLKKDRGDPAIYAEMASQYRSERDKIHEDIIDFEFLQSSDDEKLKGETVSRALTEEDFERINEKKLASQAEKLTRMSERMKKREGLIDKNVVGFVEGLNKNKTDSKFLNDEKEKSVESKRFFKDKVFKNWRFNPKASKTERERQKQKPYMMVRNKREVRNKKKLSYTNKLEKLRKTLKASQKMRK